jgi:SAM-dependent methyltransferase
MNRVELINHYLSKKDLKKYLEIGVYKGHSFNGVNAEIKDSVDPDTDSPAIYHMTSDDFFEKVATTLDYKYDVIFIDGLHHTEQVDKDIKNSLKYLEEDGVVILHDCNPINEMRQRVPADFDIWEHGWNGDVWKSVVKFRKNNSHLKYKIFVIDADEGLGVIKNGRGKELKLEIPDNLNYEFLENNRKEILNIITSKEFYLYE